LKRELQTLNHIKGIQSVDYKIMKLTKCRLENYRIEWQQLWERIVEEVPETSLMTETDIAEFMKHIKGFFDENNAMEVWNYFTMRNHK
jgi:hypothetical protein